MYRYVSHPSGSVSYLEHIGKIRSPKGSGRNFSLNNKIAAENTIKSLVSVAIYFLKYLRTLIGYRFRDSEIYSQLNKFRCGYLTHGLTYVSYSETALASENIT